MGGFIGQADIHSFPEAGLVHGGRGFPDRAAGLGGEATISHKSPLTV